jgi:hypothetical protein
MSNNNSVPGTGSNVVTKNFIFANTYHTRALSTLPTNAIESLQRFLATYTVGNKPVVELKITQRGNRFWPQDSVNAAAMKTKLCQCVLQQFNIISTQLRRGEIQQSRTKQPRRLNEQCPCVGVAHSVGRQPTQLLKLRKGFSRCITKITKINLGYIKKSSSTQPTLYSNNNFGALSAR